MVKLEGQPDLCKVDEVGELCVNANSTGISYFGLTGKTNHTFKVNFFIFFLPWFIMIVVFLSIFQKKIFRCNLLMRVEIYQKFM